jgi:hypothetical protein
MNDAPTAVTSLNWRDNVSAILGTPTADLVVTLGAEHIRAAVSAPGLRASSRVPFDPIHSGRIMSSLRRNVIPWFDAAPEKLEDERWRELRDGLSAVGSRYAPNRDPSQILDPIVPSSN